MADMPPLPPPAFRDGDALSRSELMPFRSKNISIIRSRALIPLVVTAAVCVVLFSLKGSLNSVADLQNYLRVFIGFIGFMIFFGLYAYSGEQKNILWYVFPAAVTLLQLTYLLTPYFFVFRTVLPGWIEGTSFLTAFTGMFFAAGTMEELMKAVPVLIALVVALRLRSSGRQGNFVERGLALEGPVDGLLMGAAAGAAFIVLETVDMYVPTEIRGQSGNVALGALNGVLLAVPRVLNGVIGHMAWAGIFGYFIGLAVSHRRAWPQLLLIGWLVPSVLHAFWNSSWWLLGGAGPWVSAALSLFVFVSCLLKAKQLETSRLGGPIDGHSILAASPPPGTVAPAGVVPPPAGGIAGMFTGVATALEKLVAFRAHTTVPNPGAAMAPAAIPASGLSIGTGAARYALASNQAIDFSSLFAAAGVPAGCTGTIAGTPTGGLDIRNTGTATWAVTGSDGATVSVPPGGTLTAAAGSRIALGSATIDIQAY